MTQSIETIIIHISDMLLEVWKAPGTEGVKGLPLKPPSFTRIGKAVHVMMLHGVDKVHTN